MTVASEGDRATEQCEHENTTDLLGFFGELLAVKCNDCGAFR